MTFRFIWSVVVAAAIIATLGVMCSRRSAYPAYAATIVAMCLGAIVWFGLRAPANQSSPRWWLESLLLWAPLGAVYILVPGALVRRSATPAWIIASAVGVTVAAVPLWIFYMIFLSCYLGVDCL
jgi:hypothetical protein